MDAHIVEWLNLMVRWVHMIVGIAWIGASFYFIWLENNLNRVNPKDGLTGDLWAIHGGGIYHLEKYKLAPEKMPEHLHWFKWEAYFTWITGVTLLSVVYYLNAKVFLLLPGSELSALQGIGISLASLAAAWIIYTFLCDSALGKTPVLLGIVLFVALFGAAYGFSQVFSGRAAYIHVGAVIGTIMVGNVFFIIMPAQRNLVAAIKAGTTPDPSLPAKGLLRSRHNNYLTLPVLFIMISNHFPSTYGSVYNWLILAGIAFFSILVRHYFNTRHATQKFAWALPLAALGMITLAFVTSTNMDPKPNKVREIVQAQKAAEAGQAASVQGGFSQVEAVIHERCTTCHSASPTSDLFATAPLGVLLDTPEEIKSHAAQIESQVSSKIMPLGNITQMTDDERKLVIDWVKAGANL